mgnify:CR=1 FL=1
MKKKIIIIGRSQKFIKIIKKLYIHDEISILAWRKLDKPNKYRSHKNPNIILICPNQRFPFRVDFADGTKRKRRSVPTNTAPAKLRMATSALPKSLPPLHSSHRLLRKT